MKKKDIEIFFKAIRAHDFDLVSELVSSNKEYLSVCRTSPPKKDDGQSGLQIAFKVGDIRIAKYLIEEGADVNFVEKSEINEWTAPVLHDCIRAVLFNTYTMESDTEKFDNAFSILQLMIEKGADVNGIDSYENNCLNRALSDANQMIDHPNADLENPILLNQVRSVFKILIDAGADIDKSYDERDSFKESIAIYDLQKYNLI